MLVFRPSSDFVLLDSQYDLIPFSPATLLDLSKISLSFLNSYSGTAHPQDVWTSSIERSKICLEPSEYGNKSTNSLLIAIDQEGV